MVHKLLVIVEQRIAGQNDGGVHLLRTQSHFRSRQVSARTSREAHDHGVVFVVDALERNGQIFLHLERHVLLAVGRGLTVFVGVNAEHGEVGVLARPNPVVAVAAKLAHVVGRVGHEADVAIGLLEEGIKLIATEIRHNAHIHTLLLGQVALLQQLFGHRFEKRLALTRIVVGLLLGCFSLNLCRHINDADNEGESEALRRAELFGAALGKIAVLHVVVADAAHFVNVREAAVVVGQDETIRAHHLTGATATEDADALTQRRRRFAIKRLWRQLKSCATQRVFKVLLLHEFEQPHAFVGTGAGETQHEGCAEE